MESGNGVDMMADNASVDADSHPEDPSMKHTGPSDDQDNGAACVAKNENQPQRMDSPDDHHADMETDTSNDAVSNADRTDDTAGCKKDDFVFAVPSGPAPRARTQPDDTEDELVPLTLDTLPAELFLHICSFLDAKFVIHRLSLVCHYFHGLIHDNTFWKVRIAKRWPKKYPAIPVNNAVFNWKKACIAREEQHRLWSRPEDTMNYFRFAEGIFACVDCVHLMKQGELLAVGSRDHYLHVLDLTKLDPEDATSICTSVTLSQRDAHKGWIWSLSSCDNVVASGSWDRHISFWDLGAGGQKVKDLRCQSAVLCTHYEPNFFVAGGYDKKIYHVDPRAGIIHNTVAYHKRPVLALAVDDNYIISGSEDSTVKVYDRRKAEVSATIALDAFPLCLSYGQDQLWLGDKAGQIHLVDASDGDFNLIETYSVGHTDKVSGILHNLGAIYTCSMDKTIRVLEPSLNPATITTLPQGNAGAVAGLDFKNDILVSANSDISVGIWIPKDHSWAA